jgi:tetratricopeptide (TPR) repeat protein
MKKLILTGILALSAGAFAQTAPPPAAAPAPKGPMVKSKAEAEAVQALGAAQGDPDKMIAAADNLITKFADTQFKAIALFMEGEAYRQKKDWIKAEIYYEQAIQADAKDFRAPLMLGEVIVQHVGEQDLDKEEKLAKAEKNLNMALDNLKAAEKPAQATDAQWTDLQKQFTGEADDDLGLVAMDRKKFDVAVADFRAASEIDPLEPAHQVRLASALQQSGKNDEAIALCDKVLAQPNLHPTLKQFLTGIKAQATAAKGGK